MITKDLLAAFMPMLIALVIIYFLMIRPQKKREKEIKTMRDNLQVGDEILTVGGIKGKISKLGEDFLTIETSGHTRIEFTRSAVYRVVNEDDVAARVKENTKPAETTEEGDQA